MAKIVFVDIEERDIPDCYLCKACGTQITSADDYIMLHTDTEFSGGVFEKAWNVLVDPPEKHRKTCGDLVANVHCLQCCLYLGFKYIEVHSEEDHLLRPNMLKLKLSKFLRKVGDSYYDGSVPGLIEDTSSEQV